MKNRSPKSKGAAVKRKTGRMYLHVVPRVDGWAVRTEGHSRATSTHSSQREAIEAAMDATVASESAIAMPRILFRQDSLERFFTQVLDQLQTEKRFEER